MNDINYFGRCLQALFDRLSTEVSALRWVAEDIGQLEEEQMRPSVAFPCALIDFPMATYSQLSNSIQAGEMSIVIRLAFNTFANAAANKPDSSIDASVYRYEVEQQVVNALHNWGEDELMEKLSRVQAVTERRADGMRVRALTFTTTYHDNSQETTSTTPVSSVRITMTN